MAENITNHIDVATFEKRLRECCRRDGVEIKAFKAVVGPDGSSRWGDWRITLEASLEVTDYRETGNLDLIHYSFNRLLREAVLGNEFAHWDFYGQIDYQYENFVPTGKCWSGIDFIGDKRRQIPGNGSIIIVGMRGSLLNVDNNGWPIKEGEVSFSF